MGRHLIKFACGPQDAKFVPIEGIENFPAGSAKLRTAIAVDRPVDELAKIKTGVVHPRGGGKVFPRIHIQEGWRGTLPAAYVARGAPVAL
jgi:hypothetical protein